MDNLNVVGQWHGIDVVKTETISAPLMSIKATAMNKGRARIWLESAKLSQYGFVRGAPVTITINEPCKQIEVYLDSQGDRIVAGRERNGKTLSILDICIPHAVRESIRGESLKFNVYASRGALTIVGA